MKKNLLKKFSVPVLFFLFLTPLLASSVVVATSPSLALAQNQNCAGGGVGGCVSDTENYGGIVPCSNNCNFSSLMALAQKIMNYLLILAAIVAAILFAYAGFLYVFAAGSEGSIKKAHRIFLDAGVGLVFMGAAWLIVQVILQTLQFKGQLGSF